MTVARWPEPPTGFELRTTGTRALYGTPADVPELLSRGLDDPAEWERLLAPDQPSTGRGANAVVRTSAGKGWRLKSMKRGGLLAPLWHDRYPSASRLLGTLGASIEARRRGLETPSPVALLLARDWGPLVRGFMAFEQIDGSEDLARRALRGGVTRDEVAAALAVVRTMHDRGIDHADLNLGNVLLTPGSSGARAMIVDLDRAAFVEGPLSIARRRRALRRLERSCAKQTGRPGLLGDGPHDTWAAIYAGEDASLARRLASGRTVGRLSIALHRLGWRGTER